MNVFSWLNRGYEEYHNREVLFLPHDIRRYMISPWSVTVDVPWSLVMVVSGRVLHCTLCSLEVSHSVQLSLKERKLTSASYKRLSVFTWLPRPSPQMSIWEFGQCPEEKLHAKCLSHLSVVLFFSWIPAPQFLAACNLHFCFSICLSLVKLL